MRIIFGFSTPVKEAILSKMIRAVEKRPFSHSYVRIQDPYSKQQVVFQASGLAVNIILFENFKLIENIIEEFELVVDDVMQSDIWNYILNQLGVSYSILQLFAIAIKKIFHYEPKFGNSNGDICSELSARLLTFLGFQINDNLNYVTPSDLEKFCSENLKRIM